MRPTEKKRGDIKAAPPRTTDMQLAVQGIVFGVTLAEQAGRIVLVIDPWRCDVCDARHR